MTPELDGLTTTAALATLTPADAERFRIVVTLDESPMSPLDDDGAPTILSLTEGSNYGFTPEHGDDPIGLRRALDRMGGEDYAYGGIRFTGKGRHHLSAHSYHDERVIEAAIRWARVFHGVTVERWQPRGSSQSDWGDGLMYLDPALDYTDFPAALAAWEHELSLWYAGEVYGVRVERNVSASERWDGDGEPDWETVEDMDVWGFYLDDTCGPFRRTPADVAVEEYGLPRPFAEALPVEYVYPS